MFSPVYSSLSALRRSLVPRCHERTARGVFPNLDLVHTHRCRAAASKRLGTAPVPSYTALQYLCFSASLLLIKAKNRCVAVFQRRGFYESDLIATFLN